ncbi:MAG: PAS domain S-box protein [Balneolaceae bacterium]
MKEALERHFTIIDDTGISLSELNFELCIIDQPSFKKNRQILAKKKEETLPAYLPILLLVEDKAVLNQDSSLWNLVDDIVEIPVPKRILAARIENLLRTQHYSKQVTQKNKQLRLLEEALNATGTGITIADANNPDLPVIYCNKGFEHLTGYSKDEIIGKNCRFLQNDDTDQEGLNSVRESLKIGKDRRSILRNYRKDGRPFWNELSLSPVSDNKGGISHFVGIQNDVTELIEAQKSLQEEKELYKLITDNSTDMISRHSVDCKYLFVSPSCKQLLGYDQEELIGEDPFDLFHPEDRERVKSTLKRSYFAKKTETVSYRVKSKSGEYIWMETISKIADNTELEIHATSRDISERKKNEQELQHSLSEKNVLLQEIHHRVKNNLAVISGLLQIQQFKTEDEKLSKILLNSVSRIKSMALIHEKLYQSNSLSHLDFQQYIQGLISSISKALTVSDHIKISTECDSSMLNINQAVPCALILNEAISNSFEHAFVGRKGGSISVKFKENGGVITVLVKDDGIGIPDDSVKNTKRSMGLTIIKTLLKQLNASFSINNENGTEFSFTFKKIDVKGAHSRFV